MKSEPKTHDYRYADQSEGAGVRLIVRQGNKYGAALSGEHVLVDKDELLNRSTMEACMSLEDFENMKEKARRQAEEASKPKKNAISAAVDAGLERIRKEAEKRAKEREKLEASAPPAAPIQKPSEDAMKKKSAKKSPE